MRRPTPLRLLLPAVLLPAFLLPALLLPLPAASGPTDRERLDRAFHNLYGGDVLAAVELRIDGGDGASPATVSFAYGRKRSGTETRTLLYLRESARRRDAPRALLLQSPDEGDRLFVSEGRHGQVRPLATGGHAWPLFGSDFSYADFRVHSVADFSVESLGSDHVGGQAARVLRLRPRAGPYRELLVWMSEARPVLLRVDYFDEAGLWKRYTADPRRIRQYFEWWVPMSDQMLDLRTGRRSTRVVRNILIATGVPDGLFSVTQLARGRLPSF